MVRGPRAMDPNASSRLREHLPAVLASLRQEANTALSELEIGLRRATDDLSTAIADASDPTEGPGYDALARESSRLLEAVRPLLYSVSERMIRALDRALGSALPEEEPWTALRERWEREIRFTQLRVTEYAAGFVEGGGITLALLTELPPDLTCHTGEVAAVTSERLLFLPQRAERGVTDWMGLVQRELEALAGASASSAPAAPQAAPSDEQRLGALLERAASLGVAVRNVPEQPSSAWLDKLEAHLASRAEQRKHKESPAPRASSPQDEADRKARLALLLGAAAELKLKVKDLPESPSWNYLDKMQEKLLELAQKKGKPIPLALVARAEPPPQKPPPQPSPPQPPPQAPTEPATTVAPTPPAPPPRAQRPARKPSQPPEPPRRPVADPAGADIGETEVEPEPDAELQPLRDPAFHRAETYVLPAVSTDPGARPRQAPEIPDPADDEDDAPMGAWLILDDGASGESRWPIGREELSIGRARSNTVQIRNDGGVSRHHATIRMERGRYTLVDHGSTKGTLVNGRKIDGSVTLKGGETIKVSETLFTVRIS